MGRDISLQLILHSDVQKLMDNFATVMQGKVVFFGANGEVLQRGRGEGNSCFCQMIQQHFSVRECLKLDHEKQEKAFRSGKCQMYTCHAGLREAVMPVMAGDDLLGYVVFGQFRATETLPDKLKKSFPKKEAEALEKSFMALPYISAEGMENLTGLMKLLVDYIVRSELVSRSGDYLYCATVKYIENHLLEPVTLSDAARYLGRSVSSLAHFLRKNADTTFKTLLLEKRLQLAEKLMRKNPDMMIKEVANSSGFDDQYYFSRLYRKYRGLSPSDFRKHYLEK